MSEMVERVAKSICWSVTRYTYPILLDRQVDEMVENSYREKHWIKFAERAVTAMREPTEKMIAAGTVGWDALDGSGVRPMFAPQRPWRAMIDEALK